MRTVKVNSPLFDPLEHGERLAQTLLQRALVRLLSHPVHDDVQVCLAILSVGTSRGTSRGASPLHTAAYPVLVLRCE